MLGGGGGGGGVQFIFSSGGQRDSGSPAPLPQPTRAAAATTVQSSAAIRLDRILGRAESSGGFLHFHRPDTTDRLIKQEARSDL